MAQRPPIKDEMNYEAMQQDALRGVVKMALKRAASPQGLPGDHHFYITFKTAAPGVSGPPDLLTQYPGEMTIVLQNQFWDLAPGETFFAVTLRFAGHDHPGPVCERSRRQSPGPRAWHDRQSQHEDQQGDRADHFFRN